MLISGFSTFLASDAARGGRPQVLSDLEVTRSQRTNRDPNEVD
jgi:hypothetical protein